MIKKHTLKPVSLIVLAVALAMFAPARAAADDDDPPSRVARLAYAQGSVSFQPAGTDDWVTVVVNRPMTTGDRLWSDNAGRVEMQLDGSLLRLSHNTGISFLNLSDNITQIQLSEGTLLVRVRRLDDDETYEVDTPNLAFSILRPGLYRLSVNEAGDATIIQVRSGEGEVTGGGTAYTVHAHEYDSFNGTDELVVYPQDDNYEDQFDVWSSNRDAHWERSQSARYVSSDVVGYEDLDDHGDWRPTPEYGNVWFPRTAVPGWAPYHYGHWAYIEPWGYTWVDDEPWGFAPFHYGRWVWFGRAWGWVPSPPRAEGVVYVRPVYAPALVAWVGVGVVGGAGVAWFPLGPREVYVPSYPVSRRYVNNINVSNTTVNTTVVNNYYNTTIVNKNVNVTNVTYVNQAVPGAVAATSSQAFTSAQPVARNAVKVDQHAMATAPVRAVTPAALPAKQAVLGTGQAAAVKPPAAVQSRAVVAKVAPPPPPPVFEKRQEAIKNNGGRPLSSAQVRQIQPPPSQRPAPVKVAPPAKSATPQNVQGNRPANNPPAANKPAQAQPAQPNPPAQVQPAHPDNRPADRPTPSPPAKPESTPPARTAPPPPARIAPPPPARTEAPPPRPENRPADRPAPPPPAKPAPPPAKPESTPPARTAPPPPARTEAPPARPENRPADRPAPPPPAKPAPPPQAKPEPAPPARTAPPPPAKPAPPPAAKPAPPSAANPQSQEKRQQDTMNPPKPEKDDRPPKDRP